MAKCKALTGLAVKGLMVYVRVCICVSCSVLLPHGAMNNDDYSDNDDK